MSRVMLVAAALAVSGCSAIATESPMRVGKVPVAIALADLNGDGALDIVVTSSFVDSQNHAYTSVVLSTP